MNRNITSRFIAAALIVGAAFGAASAAQARPDVQLTIGIPGLPGVPAFLQPPVPVFVRSEPVYVQPRPVYVQPPEVVYERPWRPEYRDQIQFEREHEREWRHAEWQRREWERRQAWERSSAEHRGWR
jgi:hypothetical protein